MTALVRIWPPHARTRSSGYLPRNFRLHRHRKPARLLFGPICKGSYTFLAATDSINHPAGVAQSVE